MSRYEAVYQQARVTPEKFWGDAAAAVSWYRKPDAILDNHNSPFCRWFPGGLVNACFNAVDRHVDSGRGDQLAIIFDSAMTNTRCTYTYKALQAEVARFAGGLASLGVTVGDRVIIYMPMVAESVIAMLACARLGAIHSVVFGGFAAHELAVRIDDAKPRVIVSASCGLEPARVVKYKPLLDRAIELANHAPEHCVVLQRPQESATLIVGRDVSWQVVMERAQPVECVPVDANHPLYILYTSGTTGEPKGVVRDTAGSIVSLQWTMKAVYGVAPGDVFWAASDVGWVVGHSYICYGPLFNGNTTVIYEGKPVGTPDPGAFWRVIEQHSVKVLFTAPTALRAIRQQDPAGDFLSKYDLSSLDALYLAGERCDPDTLNWALDKLNVPVIDHWWQTETGWAICANCRGIELMPVIAGSPTKPVPGYNVQVLDDSGHEQAVGEIGNLVVKVPMPPGTFTTLWNNDERFRRAYFTNFPGYYETGDAGYIDENGYVYVMARTDDVINVAGHRLSTGAIEEVLASHPRVAECAVFGILDQLKGQLPLGLIALNACDRGGSGIDDEQIANECIALVREQIGPVAAFKLCAVVQRLPKTRSGKILRSTMRSIANGEEWKMPATIDDPPVLDEITEALKILGFGLV